MVSITPKKRIRPFFIVSAIHKYGVLSRPQTGITAAAATGLRSAEGSRKGRSGQGTPRFIFRPGRLIGEDSQGCAQGTEGYKEGKGVL